MPVVFAPAQPSAPDIATAYGLAQARQQGTNTLAGLYESSARQALAREQSNADRALAAQQQDMNRIQQGAQIVRQDENQRQGRELDYQQLWSSLQPSPRDQYLAQSRAAEQQEEAKLASWLSERKLSQAEVIRKQQLDQAVGYVLQNPEGVLTPDMKKDALLKLRTGLDPLEMRLRSQQAAQVKAETAKIEAAAAQETKIRAMSATELAKHVQGMVADIAGTDSFAAVDPSTNKIAIHPKRTAREGSQAASKRGPFQYDRPFQYGDYKDEAENQAAIDFPVLPNEDGTVKDINAVARAEYIQQLIAGYKSNHVKNQHGGQQQQPAGGGQQQPAGGGQQQQPAGAEPPFDPAKPATMTTTQRLKVGQLDQAIAIAMSANLPPDVRGHAVSAATQAKAALAKYGSPEAMQQADEQLFQAFVGWLQYIAQLPKASAPPIQAGARESSVLPRLSPIDNADERRPLRDLNNMPGL